MGYTLWEGPSAYTGEPIRAILTVASGNRKTGRMAQLWILPAERKPHEAQRTGHDRAVCGDCPLRPSLGGGCYVVTCQGPLSTWKATPTGAAGAAKISQLLKGATLRLGAYGDPAALPLWLVEWLVRCVEGRTTGYTHGWRTRPDLRPYCMASVETAEGMAEAHAAGWRTFRVTSPSAPLTETEIACPSEQGIKCADCLLCRGASLRARSIAIEVHGTFARKALRVVE